MRTPGLALLSVVTALAIGCGAAAIAVDAGDHDAASDAGLADASPADTSTDAGLGDTAAGRRSRGRRTEPDVAPTYTLSGTVRFDPRAEARSDPSGSVGLDYDGLAAHPARRILREPSSPAHPRHGDADDHQRPRPLPAPRPPVDAEVKVQALAGIRGARYQPDGIPPDHCQGASFRVRVVDNTHGKAEYSLQSSASYTRSSTSADLHAGLVYGAGVLLGPRGRTLRDPRRGGPRVELLCEGVEDPSLPLLTINWSKNNVPASGDFSSGGRSAPPSSPRAATTCSSSAPSRTATSSTVTSSRTRRATTWRARCRRSDSQGGSRSDGDTLDPATAFSEGYGNAVSGMVFDDPLYVDTSGAGQAEGFSFDVSEPPSGDDRGVYSEWSVQYLLWSLYENRDPALHSGGYDRIHPTLRDHVRTSEAVVCLQTFAAYYRRETFGNAEGLRELLNIDLATPYDALCRGTCSGAADRADPFALDDDIGREYSGTGTSTTPRHSRRAHTARIRLRYSGSSTGRSRAARTTRPTTIGRSSRTAGATATSSALSAGTGTSGPARRRRYPRTRPRRLERRGRARHGGLPQGDRGRERLLPRRLPLGHVQRGARRLVRRPMLLTASRGGLPGDRDLTVSPKPSPPLRIEDLTEVGTTDDDRRRVAVRVEATEPFRWTSASTSAGSRASAARARACAPWARRARGSRRWSRRTCPRVWRATSSSTRAPSSGAAGSPRSLGLASPGAKRVLGLPGRLERASDGTLLLLMTE